jgi:hypothetical protein
LLDAKKRENELQDGPPRAEKTEVENEQPKRKVWEKQKPKKKTNKGKAAKKVDIFHNLDNIPFRTQKRRPNKLLVKPQRIQMNKSRLRKQFMTNPRLKVIATILPAQKLQTPMTTLTNPNTIKI